MSEFDPNVITNCFRPWYFNQTSSGAKVPPTLERFPAVISRMTGFSTPRQIHMDHLCFLRALLFEHVWIPGQFNRKFRRGDPTLPVTQILYLLRMVTGATVYVGESDW